MWGITYKFCLYFNVYNTFTFQLQHVITVTDKNIEDDYERLKLVYNRLFDSRSLFKEYTYAGKGEKLPLIGHRTIIEINSKLLFNYFSP